MQGTPSRASYASTSAAGGPQPRHAGPQTHSVHHKDELNAHEKLASANSALDRVLGLMDGFEDDMECPLCLEEMDVTDLNFKPCPCGYQICQFCFHHIKENLNRKCPACRAIYDESKAEFKSIKPEELKRINAAKKLRDKRRKDDELHQQARQNIRVRQRTQVHVQGMTTKIANEDTIAHLKGPDQFGQYGKVLKLFMNKRQSNDRQPATSSTHPLHQPVNVYVNYKSAHEAQACIAAVNDSVTPDGHKLKAFNGTTRYCPTYLKGARCYSETCMFAHEPGEEIDTTGPTSREEIYANHAVSDVELQRTKSNGAGKDAKNAATLPATASWASKNAAPTPTTAPIIFDKSMPPLSATLPKPAPIRQTPIPKPTNHPLPPRPTSRPVKDPTPAAAAAARPRSTSTAAPPAAVASPAVAAVPLPPVPTTSTATAAATPSPSPSAPPPVDAATASILSNAKAAAGVTPPPFMVSPLPAPQIATPPVQTFPEMPYEFGDGFNFSLNLDVKGKGRQSVGGEGQEGVPNARPFEFANLDAFQPGGLGSLVPALFSPPPKQTPPAVSYIGSFDPFAIDLAAPVFPERITPEPPVELPAPRESRFGFARQASGQHQLPPGFGGAPPGIGLPPHMQRQQSSDWSGPYSPQNANLLARLNGQADPGSSNNSSPQLSPHQASRYPPGMGPPAGSANQPLPPGLNRSLPSGGLASLPLPPPSNNGPTSASSNANANAEILKMLRQSQSQIQQQQQQQQRSASGDASGQFMDPAILSSRGGLAHLPLPAANGNGNVNGGQSNGFSGSLPNGMASSAHFPLDGAQQGQFRPFDGQQQAQQNGFLSNGPPPGMRPQSQNQQTQHQLQQQQFAIRQQQLFQQQAR